MSARSLCMPRGVSDCRERRFAMGWGAAWSEGLHPVFGAVISSGCYQLKKLAACGWTFGLADLC